MNILGLVFSLLLILSYGFYACWDKQFMSTRLQNTHLGHQKAQRHLLNQYQSQLYKKLPGKGKQWKPAEKKKNPLLREKKAPALPEPNGECAKINLWPLLQEGREAHPLLYTLTANLIRTFYGPLLPQKGGEHYLLDLLLKCGKEIALEGTACPLEKIALSDPRLQKIYYKMLKGTKEWNLGTGAGYPPLLDYVKAAPSSEKICLSHAHPDLLTVLFTPAIAAKLYGEMHRPGGPPLTPELIERICTEMAFIGLDRTLFTLLELQKTRHEEVKKMLVAKDPATQITLRQNVTLKAP